jgi:hypothetical protein
VQDTDLTTYVIERLVGAENPDDIIYDLCEKTGWPWSQAEAFVRQVQERHQGDVVKRQFPLLFTIAIATYLAGIGLMAYSMYSVFEIMKIIQGSSLPYPDAFSSIRIILDIAIGPVILFCTGLAMILGSLIGMRDAWMSILVRT